LQPVAENALLDNYDNADAPDNATERASVDGVDSGELA